MIQESINQLSTNVLRASIIGGMANAYAQSKLDKFNTNVANRKEGIAYQKQDLKEYESGMQGSITTEGLESRADAIKRSEVSAQQYLTKYGIEGAKLEEQLNNVDTAANQARLKKQFRKQYFIGGNE